MWIQPWMRRAEMNDKKRIQEIAEKHLNSTLFASNCHSIRLNWTPFHRLTGPKILLIKWVNSSRVIHSIIGSLLISFGDARSRQQPLAWAHDSPLSHVSSITVDLMMWKLHQVEGEDSWKIENSFSWISFTWAENYWFNENTQSFPTVTSSLQLIIQWRRSKKKNFAQETSKFFPTQKTTHDFVVSADNRRWWKDCGTRTCKKSQAVASRVNRQLIII